MGRAVLSTVTLAPSQHGPAPPWPDGLKGCSSHSQLVQRLCTLAQSWSREWVSSFSRDVKNREGAVSCCGGRGRAASGVKRPAPPGSVRDKGCFCLSLGGRESAIWSHSVPYTQGVLGGQQNSNSKRDTHCVQRGSSGEGGPPGVAHEGSCSHRGASEEATEQSASHLLGQSSQSSVRESSGRWSCWEEGKLELMWLLAGEGDWGRPLLSLMLGPRSL